MFIVIIVLFLPYELCATVIGLIEIIEKQLTTISNPYAQLHKAPLS